MASKKSKQPTKQIVKAHNALIKSKWKPVQISGSFAPKNPTHAKLTKELANTAAKLVYECFGYRTCCKVLNLSESVWHQWLQWARDSTEPNIYTYFATQVAAATAQRNWELIQAARKGGAGARENLILLSKLDPMDYGEGSAKYMEYLLKQNEGAKDAKDIFENIVATVKQFPPEAKQALRQALDDSEPKYIEATLEDSNQN